MFSSGREALLALLQSIDIKPGDEVIIQGYTCAVVPNAIQASGAKPIYCDIEKNSLGLDCNNLNALINSKTRAVICQHTFGIPADLKKIKSVCKQNNIILIEDSAHVIFDDYANDNSGGDFILLSFGRDKALSGVTGGAVISSNTETDLNLCRLEESAVNLPFITIFRLLFYPSVYALAKPFYGLIIGKAFLKFAQAFGLLVPVLTSAEKGGKQSDQLHKLPAACAVLLLDEWIQLKKINDHRRKLTEIYLKNAKINGWNYPKTITTDLPLQKFPLFSENADTIRRHLKRFNIHLNDGWCNAVVNPKSVNQAAAGYIKGLCPVAEEVSQTILNLPVHPTATTRQIQKLIACLYQNFA